MIHTRVRHAATQRSRLLHATFRYVNFDYGFGVALFKMERLSIQERLHVITLHSNNFSVPAIHERFKEEMVSVSVRALYNLVQKHDETGIIVDLPRQRKERKMSEEKVQFIEQELRKDDELTSTGIRALLLEKWDQLTYMHKLTRKYSVIM